jgi:hypothetical protein
VPTAWLTRYEVIIWNICFGARIWVSLVMARPWRPAALDAALAHAGVCVVPCYVAVGQPIVRMTEQVLAASDVYAVVLSERRGEARLRVVIDALLDMFDRERASLSGQGQLVYDCSTKSMDIRGQSGSSPNKVPTTSSIASNGSGRTVSPRSARTTVM